MPHTTCSNSCPHDTTGETLLRTLVRRIVSPRSRRSDENVNDGRHHWKTPGAADPPPADASPARQGRTPAATLTRLRIMATTDLHMQILPWDYFGNCPAPGRGLARIAAMVARHRAAHPNTLLLDNGDFLHGNPLGDFAASTASGDRVHPGIAAMNALRYDAATLGNHDFNHGAAFLLRALAGARHPVTLANLGVSGDPGLIAALCAAGPRCHRRCRHPAPAADRRDRLSAATDAGLEHCAAAAGPDAMTCCPPLRGRCPPRGPPGLTWSSRWPIAASATAPPVSGPKTPQPPWPACGASTR